jgi:hypothetical protein
MKKLLIPVLFLLAVTVNAQNKPKSTENYNLIQEGKGMSGITVGRSTMNDVIKKFGKDYKWIENKKYSYQMTYANGLSFYICQSDKRKQIFVIEMRPPYKAKTSRGITMGKSTLAEVHKKYGKLKSGTEYRGISFYYRNLDGKNIITSMDVTENSGIRQCKVGK